MVQFIATVGTHGDTYLFVTPYQSGCSIAIAESLITGTGQ